MQLFHITSGLYNSDVQIAGLVVVLLVAFQTPSFQWDPPHKCEDCPAWNKGREPFKLYGNTYYVGTDGLSSILITGDAGHILLDGGLEQSAPLIDANIRKLGFKTQDVKLIVNSHGHFDHAALHARACARQHDVDVAVVRRPAMLEHGLRRQHLGGVGAWIQVH